MGGSRAGTAEGRLRRTTHAPCAEARCAGSCAALADRMNGTSLGSAILNRATLLVAADWRRHPMLFLLGSTRDTNTTTLDRSLEKGTLSHPKTRTTYSFFFGDVLKESPVRVMFYLTT